MWIRIPTPASFFQPLYHQHNGNFKEWIHKDQASNQYGCSGKLSQDLREVKRLHVSRGVTVVLSPWDEAVSNISNLKPIAINHALPFDMGTKSSLQTDSSNPFQYTPSLEYCHKSALDGLLPRLFQEEQHISENGTLCQDSSHGSFLGTMSQEEDEGYSYSDEYCTLAHSDSSRGLVPAKVGLQLKVSNKLQEEKREMAEDLAMIDDGRLPLFCLPSSSLDVTVSTGGPCQWETQQNPILGSDTSQTLRVTIKQ
ncbi:uncharacterized protein [Narcine bancroftii]|uniref:uncharacterized protein n=1 Tax=Narcine bancroftii TaxID=1343680 RepID=UPI0038322966